MKTSLRRIGLLAAPCWLAAMAHGQGCPYVLRLLDAGGDGWNGSYVTVHFVMTGQPWVSTDHTLSGGASEDIAFDAPYNSVLLLEWTAVGSDADEVGVQLFAGSGDDLAGLFDGVAPLPIGPLYARQNTTDCVPPPRPPTDCHYALDYGTEPPTWWAPPEDFPSGMTQDLDELNSGCLSAEHHATWFLLSTGDWLFGLGGGRLTLTITPHPQDVDAEIDFALWPAPVWPACPSGAPLRCSAALNSGATGMAETAADQSEDTSGDGWVQELMTNANEQYILLVDHRNGTGEHPFKLVVTTTPLITGEAEWEADDKHTLFLFPNPATDHVTVNYTGTAPRSGALLIFDATGRQVASHPIPPYTGHWTIDVGSLGPGAYTVVGWRDEQQERAGLIIH